ncbi:ABC transporter ATP-binding protein [Blastococcus saxobsidens]|uniref:Lipopolysaccharide exporter n=1 Tax=Blastococcus saxobsidens (strain DD2) TaxID=1146883 RepID=H6RL16_BLASD|nr:ABC transporter ATP-binding protein [Blastococcus saxobsidens]CCG04983.1 Lipopolysaccharide exporter [Blastococcus saxobsidens DD2]
MTSTATMATAPTTRPSPEIIRVSNVSKRFVLHKEQSLKERVLRGGWRGSQSEDFWALRDVDLSIGAGSTVGLMGSNGSGKSTLLKIIGAIIQPTTGTVMRRGRLAALLELGAGFHPDLTGRENVYLNAAILGMSRQETDRQFDAIVDFSGIEHFIDNQVKFYSSGMYVRLAFAVAIHVDPDLLLVDEVLAVGDEPFQRKCMDKIRSFQEEGRTIVLVSHSAEQVGDLCDRAVLLRDGVMQFDGAPREAIRALRAGFDEDRREEAERKSEVVGEPVASRGSIQSVDLRTPTGEPAQRMTSGCPLVAHVAVDLDDSVGRWMMGLAIETPLGQRVYHVNTHMEGVDLKTGAGRHEVSFSLPRVPLGEGEYVVRVGVGEVKGEMIDLQAQAATFSVDSDTPGNGVVAIDTDIDVRS